MVAGKRHFKTGWTHFWKQIFKLLRNPIFFILTVFGNVAVFVGAFCFFLAEQPVNKSVMQFGDALWWAFATITTVGYGDVVPVTAIGRLIAVGLMLTGGVLFLSFVALLSSVFIELEFLELGRKIEDVERKVDEIMRNEPE